MNSFYDEWSASLASALPALTGLVQIDVSGNRLGAAGAASLAAALTSLTGLAHLNAGANHMGDEGATALAAAVTGLALTSLALFSVRGSNSGAAGLTLPADAMTTLSELTHLTVSYMPSLRRARCH